MVFPGYARQSGPDPVNTQDLSTKHYVDLRTPSLPAPVTTGTTIQTYADPVGEVWVAKNGVNSGAWLKARDVLCGRVWRNAAITVGIAYAAYNFDTVQYDPYGMYNLGTGFWTTPVTGIYSVEAAIIINLGTGWCGLQINAGGIVQEDRAAAAGYTLPHTHTIMRWPASTTIGFNAIATTASAAFTSPWNGWSALNYLGTG